jgi:Ca2+-binding RTX toxin-like protein
MATITGNNRDNRLIGTSGKDLIYGRAGNDFIDGREGNDGLYGELGNDTIIGGAGNDDMGGGDGNDSLDGGEGIDQVRARIDVNATLTNTSLVGNGNDTLVSIERAFLDGNESNNIIDASAFTGSVYAIGDFGNDTLLGATGSDQIFGDSGHDAIAGNAGNDAIEGGLGNDMIAGDAGDDVIYGYRRVWGYDYDSFPQIADYDTLTGGTGADKFALGGVDIHYLGAGQATITDFSLEQGDQIQLYKSADLYNLQLGSFGGSSSLQDTAIYSGTDLIGVVHDVNLIGANVFTYVQFQEPTS